MNTEQINIVQSSFAKVAPASEKVAALFYEKLFMLDPALKPLFKGDMQEQGKKLMQMIAVAVGALNKIETVVPAVQALGARHAGYGVKDKDYDTVGSALLATLEAGLGADFTPQVRESWTAAYTLLAGVMKGAAAKS